MNMQEMRKTEALCIEEHAPACEAGCPLHIDMRGVMRALREGDTAAAAALFSARALFPRVLAKICDAPCERVCTRAHVDEAVSIGAVERYILRAFPKTPMPIRPTMQQGERVAVIGAGLSGMAAARVLVDKGYCVTVYERDAAALPNILGINGVDQADIEADTTPLMDLIDFRPGTDIGTAIPYEDVLREHRAVFISGMLPEAYSAMPIDRATLRVGETNIFAAGRRLLKHTSPVTSLSDGRRAGLSADRYMQRVSLTAARVHEGAYETDLPVDTAGVAHAPRMEGPLDAAAAQMEAARCLNCHCMQCVRACKFMQKFEKFPRLYIREIANTIGLMGSGMRSGKNLLAACSMCGLCKEICPNAILMPEVVHDGRRAMVEKGEFSAAIFDFPVRDMLFSNSDSVSLCRHAPGEHESDYLFFPGCQLAACDPDHILPTYAALRKLHPKTGIFLGCCGAPADWAGREELYQSTVAALKARIAEMGTPALITACPTCEKQLHAAGVNTVSAWNMLAAGKMDAREVRGEVAIHDSCTARHDTAMQDSIRNIVRSAGYGIAELPFSRGRTKCCGYGGLVFYGDREVAHAMIEERAAESPLPYVAYCSVCRDYLAKTGKEALHVLDLLFSPDIEAAKKRPPVDLSKKEYNRERLRAEILHTLYGEETRAEDGVKLFIAEDVRERLDDRLITQANIRRTILNAEKTGRRLVRPADGHFIAGGRPGIITYWVEYAPQDDGYAVYNAYSHRVHIQDAEIRK